MAYGSSTVRGVGGWLVFFLVTLGLFTPLGVLVSALQVLDSSEVDPGLLAIWPRVAAAEWALAGITILACWFATYRFLRVHNWTTVRIGIGVLVAVTLIAVLIEPLVVSAMLGASPGQVFGASAAEYIRPCIYCGIWTTYLLRSQRVANTYGSGLSEAEALGQVFE
jgi:Protein of unknown function (DUF2569)